MTLSILGCQMTWNEVHQNGLLFNDNFWPVLPQNSRSRKIIPALGELLLPSLLHRVDNFFHTCHFCPNWVVGCWGRWLLLLQHRVNQYQRYHWVNSPLVSNKISAQSPSGNLPSQILLGNQSSLNYV